MLLQILFRQIDDLGGDAFALQILDRFHRRIFRHAQHPAGRAARNLAEQKLADLVDLRAVLDDPIVTGDAAIEIAVLDVTADFLRANQPDFQLVVIHIGNVGTAADLDVKAGLGHLFDGGVLQTAFRQTES